MVKYQRVKATEDHARELAETMRQADIEELWAGWSMKPLDALLLVVGVRDTRTVLADGVVLCMYGTAPPVMLSFKGVPWMLTSDIFPIHFRYFLRGSIEYINEMKEKFEFLENYVDARNPLAIRWLKWLGFKIGSPDPFGWLGAPFHRFEMEGIR